MIGDTTSIDPLLQFAQFGAVGLVVIGLLIGWIWPRPSVERLLADNDMLRRQRDELIKYHQEQTIPALVHANDLLTRFADRRNLDTER